MEEVRYIGRDWTWANNRVGERFVEERLDRFFASPEWHYLFPKAVVHHVLKQSSNHCLLILEDNPVGHRAKSRFQFDKRLLDDPEFEEVVENAWNDHQQGTPMYQLCGRIRSSGIALLKLKSMIHMNSAQAISGIKRKMETMQCEGRKRNWIEWKMLKQELGEQYRRGEVYWR